MMSRKKERKKEEVVGLRKKSFLLHHPPCPHHYDDHFAPRRIPASPLELTIIKEFEFSRKINQDVYILVFP